MRRNYWDEKLSELIKEIKKLQKDVDLIKYKQAALNNEFRRTQRTIYNISGYLEKEASQ